MLLTCPCCHSRYSVDAMLQDEAARDLLALRGSLPPRIWQPLIAYLGLFRSESRSLAWDRALKLSREIQELGITSGEWDKLENALCETVESLRQRGGKPLKNHNYLKRVFENQPAGRMAVETVRGTSAPLPAKSKAAQAITALENWIGEDWLRRQIAVGLAALVAQNLKHAPAAEIITNNADIWHVSLKKQLTIEAVDSPRIMAAFEKLLPTLTEWPQPKQLLDMLPARPHRAAIRHELTDEQYADNAARARELADKFK